MSNVKAISGATAEEFDKLTAKAKEEGATTKFTAKDSADAFGYMAMAGWKTEDMLQGIDGIMSLAAASNEDLATTSDIVTDALTAFGLKASDSGHFADVLAQASANANHERRHDGRIVQVRCPCGRRLEVFRGRRFPGPGPHGKRQRQGLHGRHQPENLPCEHGSAHRQNGSRHGQVRHQPDQAQRRNEDHARGFGQLAQQPGRPFRNRTDRRPQVPSSARKPWPVCWRSSTHPKTITTN